MRRVAFAAEPCAMRVCGATALMRHRVAVWHGGVKLKPQTKRLQTAILVLV